MTLVLDAPKPTDAGFLNKEMNELFEALQLPQTSRVPASWVPPKPAFLTGSKIDEEAEEVETTHEGQATEGPTEPGTEIHTAEPIKGDGSEPRNVHTHYGTAKQWTRNVDRVMSGLCKWLHDAEDRSQFSVIGPNGETDHEDFKFMQVSIGEYMDTLETNLSPKAAAMMAVTVVYIGWIAEGVFIKGKQLVQWVVKWYKERQAEKDAETREAYARQERQEFAQMLAEAVERGQITPDQAMATMAQHQAEAMPAEPATEPGAKAEPEVVSIEHQDPDFRPLAVDPHHVTRDELKKRVANGFCVLPSCNKALPGRNNYFCCKDHSNEYFSLMTECNLPIPKEI